MVFALLLAGASSCHGQTERNEGPTEMILSMADSLFAARQYTQAFEMYRRLRENGFWSPAMFLKMAYIHEGLGHLGESLYYLNLYAIASHDEQAEAKMAQLAEKNRLQGYDTDPVDSVRASLREYYFPLTALMASMCLLVLFILLSRARKNQSPSVSLAFVLLLMLTTLYLHVDRSKDSDSVIVIQANTYLMSDPSSASHVVEIISEGHRLQIKGRNDAWLRVSWRDSEAFIRDSRVRLIKI